jgi:hypothetical protein
MGPFPPLLFPAPYRGAARSASGRGRTFPLERKLRPDYSSALREGEFPVIYQYLAKAAAAAALLLAAMSAQAQEAPAPPEPVATEPAAVAPAEAEAPAPAEPATVAPAEAPATGCCTVPARTPIEIEILDTVNSKANHNGDNFTFRLAVPLTIDGHIVIPAGTTGVGEVVHAERARFGGRAGELILAARYLDHAGARIVLRTLRFGPQQGHDSSGTINSLNLAAAATIPALAMIGYLVAGGEVNVPAGTHASAQIAAELTLAPAEPTP